MHIDPKLIVLLKEHWPKTYSDQTELFCLHWLDEDYYVGWYRKGDRRVYAIRIKCPANAPAGFITASQSMVFDIVDTPTVFRDGFNVTITRC